MAEHQLGILHLADLHAEAPSKDGGALSRARVLDAGWEQSVAEVAAAGPIDLVALTGDSARGGRAVEYAALTGFVDILTARLGVPRERVFVVPGNHDVNRRVARGAWEALRRLGDEDDLALSRWMAGGSAPEGADPAHRAAILRRQADYRRWVRAVLGRPALVPGPRSAHPRLGYRETLAVRDLPFPVHVIGLDSAWLAGADGDVGALRLTPDQILRLATADGERLPGFRLALVHHPTAQLADGERCRPLLDEHTDSDPAGAPPRDRPLPGADRRARAAPARGRSPRRRSARAQHLPAHRFSRSTTRAACSGGRSGCGASPTPPAGPTTTRSTPPAPRVACAGSRRPRPRPIPPVAPPTPELDLRAGDTVELGAAGAALARILDLPWTGPETWVLALARLLRLGARLRVSHAGTAAAGLVVANLRRRLLGAVIEAVLDPPAESR